jgi:hypothetical protein
MEYVYLGDRNTSSPLKKAYCNAVRRNGKCIRGKNGSMMVQFEDGKTHVVIARLLRKTTHNLLAEKPKEVRRLVRKKLSF